MSLGLIIISAISGLLTVAGLYLGGQVSLAGGLGVYTGTGVLVMLAMSAALFAEAHASKS